MEDRLRGEGIGVNNGEGTVAEPHIHWVQDAGEPLYDVVRNIGARPDPHRDESSTEKRLA